jgi:LPXTG-motif cell wall-anchored protein
VRAHQRESSLHASPQSGKVYAVDHVLYLELRSQLTSRSALAALAAVAVPVPLHMVGAHKHRSPAKPERPQHGIVKPHKPAPVKPQQPAAVNPQQPAAVKPQQPTAVKPQQPTSADKRLTGRAHQHGTLVFRVTHHNGWANGRRNALARTASDPADTISDYKFSPASLTIHVGDTITWTNDGPAAHTATANDGSFDTGTLKKGQSASHTFTKAGTFAYICKIHPFMHGTVVVVANTTTRSNGSGGGSGSGSGSSGSSGSGSGTSNPSGSAASAPTTPAATGPSLPNTGLNILPILGAGLLLLGIGMAMSRRARSHA